METSLLERVDSLGDRMNVIPGRIEGGQHRPFAILGSRIEPEKNALLEKERHFHRSVIGPETDSAPYGIVPATGIGEAQRHFSLSSDRDPVDPALAPVTQRVMNYMMPRGNITSVATQQPRDRPK